MKKPSLRNRFLTVHDYGTGGVWQYFYADSPEQIMAKYPQLRVVDSIPDWLEEPLRGGLRSYDIDQVPDEFLQTLVKEER